MLTREEALDTMGATLDDWIDKKNMHMLIDKIYDNFEEAMKPKTCEGCVYEDKDGVLNVECAFCLRNSNDNFKPKDTQC